MLDFFKSTYFDFCGGTKQSIRARLDFFNSTNKVDVSGPLTNALP
jgi:hypothetical protein